MTEGDVKFEEAKGFVSGLGIGREAFHSEITEYCLKIGERTSDDFIRLFSPMQIMQKLASRPMERARIIAEATGVNDRVAQKMSPENSGEALQIALDEKVTTTADILRLFQPDDRQRYLDRKELWKFDIEGEPWKVTATSKASYERAKAYIAYIIERAISNLLLTHDELIEALTVAKLAEHLPREVLGSIINASLRRDEKFNEVHLMEVAPPKTLVKHVPLDYVWDKAVRPLVAERHEYAEAGASNAKAEGAKASTSKADAKAAKADGAKAEGAKAEAAKEGSKPSNAKPDAGKAAEEKSKDKELEPSWSLPPAAEKSGDEDSDLVGEDEIMEDAPPSSRPPAQAPNTTPAANAAGGGRRSIADIIGKKR